MTSYYYKPYLLDCLKDFEGFHIKTVPSINYEDIKLDIQSKSAYSVECGQTSNANQFCFQQSNS
jgi:hypothetical protein